jgi:hypothetical protein
MTLSVLALSFIVFIHAPVSFAQSEGKWSGQGEVGFELRRFEDDGKKITEDTGVAILSRVETRYDDEYNTFVLRAFGRVDEKDPDRGFVALEDAYVSERFGTGNTRLTAGYKLFSWTATEAFHPADVINSRNFDSDLENLEKKGEITIQLAFDFLDGQLNLYYWPHFEAPEYPSYRSRVGAGVSIGKPVVVDGTSSSSAWLPQFGAMFNTSFPGGDLSLHAIRHVDRNFPLVGTSNYVTLLGSNIPNDLTAFQTAPTPYFFQATQLGGTLQWSLDPVMLKVEGAVRQFESELAILTARGLKKPNSHSELAVGLEWSMAYDESNAETYFYLEGNSIIGISKEERAQQSVFQRDVMFGIRHVLNDIDGKEVFISTIMDIERTHEKLFNFSYTQRLSDIWKIKTGIRHYQAPQQEALPKGLETFDGDSAGYFNLIRYF